MVSSRRIAGDALESVLGLSPRIGSVMENLPVGVFVADAEGRVVLKNSEAYRIWGGIPPVVGSFEEPVEYEGWLAATGEALGPQDWALARAVSRGETTRSEVVDIERFDGSRGTILSSAVPIRDEAGAIQGAFAVIQDITEQRERQRLSAALTEIDSVISSTLDTEEILTRVIAKTARAVGAESAALYALRNDRWEVQHVYGEWKELRGREFSERELWYSREVLRTEKLVVVPDMTCDGGVDRRPAEGLGAKGLVDAAVIVRGELIGDLSLRYDHPLACFTEAEREFVSGVAFSLSQALTSASRYEGERDVARALQQALLEVPEKVPGIAFSYDYTSAADVAAVGGDFYDLVPLGGDRVAVVIGDVSGKGLEAARVMMMVKSALRAYAFAGEQPADVMRQTNELVVTLTKANIFVTAFLGILDVNSGALTYCSAGHPPAMVRRTDGGLTVLAAESPLVGGFAGLEFAQAEESLRVGDYLFLYTDGAIEAHRDGEMFGQARLASVVQGSRSGREACERVVETVTGFSGGKLLDDLAVLAVSLDPGSARV